MLRLYLEALVDARDVSAMLKHVDEDCVGPTQNSTTLLLARMSCNSNWVYCLAAPRCPSRCQWYCMHQEQSPCCTIWRRTMRRCPAAPLLLFSNNITKSFHIWLLFGRVPATGLQNWTKVNTYFCVYFWMFKIS